MSNVVQMLEHPSVAVIGASVATSTLTATVLGAIPPMVSLVAGLLTIIYMAIQIALGIRTWRRGKDLGEHH